MSFKSLLVRIRRALAVTTISLIGCTAVRGKILERKYVVSLKVVDDSASSRPRITVSGSVFHSSLAVASMKSEVHGGAIDITIYLLLVRPGLSGDFSYEVPIPASVNEVRFGRE